MIQPALILTRKDLVSLMAPADYLVAVETAFRADKAGRALSPLPMHIDGEGVGAFHAKGAAFFDDRAYVALKLNGNFPNNPEDNGLPTIQGAVLLCNARNGSLLAVIDSIEVTLRRTAAASALAAKHLARRDSRVLTICGCGDQGRAHVDALSALFDLNVIHAWDIDAEKAAQFADDISNRFDINVEIVEDLSAATQKSDIIATCTSAREPFLTKEHVPPGAFIAALGADNPNKNEIAPALMALATVVCDVIAQGAEMGDLRAAIAAGAMSEGDVYADLGDVVTGRKPGRRNRQEIIVFDSTGTALQDVTSAAKAYERALETGAGQKVALGAL